MLSYVRVSMVPVTSGVSTIPTLANGGAAADGHPIQLGGCELGSPEIVATTNYMAPKRLFDWRADDAFRRDGASKRGQRNDNH